MITTGESLRFWTLVCGLLCQLSCGAQVSRPDAALGDSLVQTRLESSGASVGPGISVALGEGDILLAAAADARLIFCVEPLDCASPAHWQSMHWVKSNGGINYFVSAAPVALSHFARIHVAGDGAAKVIVRAVVRRIDEATSEKMIVFTYGTLQPCNEEAAASGQWTRDEIRGRMYSLGSYPGLVDHTDEAAPWVSGYFKVFDRKTVLTRMDPYENVAAGLYRRVRVTTRSGVDAQVYVYNRRLPTGSAESLSVWRGRCGVTP